MNRDKITQVRLDHALAESLGQYIAELRTLDPRASESMAVRELLRDALGRHQGRMVSPADSGFSEGLRRGYDEIRRAITEAVRPLLGRDAS